MKFSLFSVVVLLMIACGTAKSDGNPEETIAQGKEVVCFVYHRFGDDRFASTNVSIDHFKAHLQYLKDHNYQVLTFAEAIQYLKGDGPAQKTAVITIDDGYKSFFENGLPVLREYGFPASLYINTETVGGSDYMTWAQIKQTKDAGIEIGNHTHSHAYFLNQPASSRYKNFEAELQKSQDLIKEQLGEAPVTFAYPYGELDAKMKAIVSEYFEAAAAQNSGVIGASTDLMRCPRFPMSEYYSDPKKFAEKARMHVPEVTVDQKSFMLPAGQETPSLKVTFHNDDLQLDQLQCFVQGGDCAISRDGNKVSVKSETSIANRRRTLYTLTVPDKSGNWYWYSHLWINPEVN
ncbi:polysaccharide deacetylase family protein [Marinoscillum furvescens]|uniref:Polysaccharide deacetylase n=1 Tax=Marinoscillum furvescens DSM 4134 TaxID=1122208 RepID=A0A3D9L6E7_MARFU|nr:polysaccharide deacetylase family protein [Marinoscillum furvescens]REE01750.1 polysaccharide deacetylase [Marinoscillum furvescens DSM 4134]